MYDDVLLPVDGSQASHDAIEHAGAVADQFGAQVHVLAVIDLPTEAVGAGAGDATATVIETLHDEAEQRVAEVAGRLPDGVATTEVVLEGYPAAAIREYAAEHDLDVIVMGTHGRTGVERYLLGSTAERVVRTAEPPVLTVGSPAE